MKNLLCFVALLALLASCRGQEVEVDSGQQAKQALVDAITALNSHDYEAYYHALDFGCEIDSVQQTVILRTLIQHQSWQDQRKGQVADIRAVNADMICDSVLMVYYQLTFADSTQVVSSQKMVRHGGTWKLRVRN